MSKRIPIARFRRSAKDRTGGPGVSVSRLCSLGTNPGGLPNTSARVVPGFGGFTLFGERGTHLFQAISIVLLEVLIVFVGVVHHAWGDKSNDFFAIDRVVTAGEEFPENRDVTQRGTLRVKVVSSSFNKPDKMMV